MTTYKILVSSSASKEFKDLQKKEQGRIREKLKELAEDPNNKSNRLDTKKLSGDRHSYFRIRVGNYRVIYYLEEETIKVVRIAIRSDAYSWLD
ncbi:MAG: type II toxin-antitoxin system RelE family toxin [Thermoplasmataceae archaeon]|uniref:type II toxin-antitoxin system RelE family toxin n=1 Tax=Ferroplasma sp. Type II TaxID=261388 RepID=UPI000389695A|nr:type II toxin-antitoxin system RelE/ParE family toxin [Ferroplasma sp. Type II]EQB72929.1 MAG: addiction module toxin, RelE/StbE family [Ferroplasma sp. Type II]